MSETYKYLKHMKKQLFDGLCIAALMSACTPQVPDNEYRIEGMLTGVPDGVVIDLYKNEGNLGIRLQRDTLRDGKFTFRDTISSTERRMILVVEKDYPLYGLDVWVAPGQRVNIAGKDKFYPLWDVESDIPEQQEENRFKACAGGVFRHWLEYNIVEYAFIQEADSVRQTGDNASFKQAWAKVDSVRRLSRPLEVERAKREVECLRTAPLSPVWLNRLRNNAGLVQIARQMEDFAPFAVLGEPLQEIFTALPDSVRQSAEGKTIYGMLFPQKRVGVGDEMADAILYDTDGNEHRLAEFKGKYILLDFWEQGCVPCMESLPELEEVGDTYADCLAIVSVSIDPGDWWKKFVREKGLKGNQWNELREQGGTLGAAYGVIVFPYYVLIAPDGKVQDIWTGYTEGRLKKKLKENLK